MYPTKPSVPCTCPGGLIPAETEFSDEKFCCRKNQTAIMIAMGIRLSTVK